MRGAVLLACLTAACGRIGFAERTGDGGGTTGDTGSNAGDGSSSVTMWTHLTAYANSTCALRGGVPYCWGDNSAGQLGMTAGGFAKTPTKISLTTVSSITDLSVGTVAGCAIAGGELFCWGALGSPAPMKVALPTAATSVSVGHNFQCVIAGDAYCWGTINSSGQLGTNDTMAKASPTLVVHSGAAYVSVEVGDDHSCALDSAGVAWCWGHNDYGCINLAMATNDSTTPVAQNNQIQAALPQIAGWHTCARVANEVDCWGEGDNGELGDGNGTSSVLPLTVVGLTAPKLVATGGGPTDRDASCAIDSAGVKCWGNGLFGRLGQGSASNAGTPVMVQGLPAAATEVAIGYDHACAALVDGDLYCWGRGDTGQLGDGNGASSLTPVKVINPP